MKLTEIIMSYAKMECPLCRDKIKTKMYLRQHLNKEHTEYEAKRFIKKHK